MVQFGVPGSARPVFRQRKRQGVPFLVRHGHCRVPAPFAFLTGSQRKDQASDDLLDRLADVPVFYVSDGKTAITVRSEGSKEMCLFFIDAAAAQAYLDEATRLTEGQANYQLAVMPLDAAVKATQEHKDLAFRFVPAEEEVQAALELYKGAGVSLAAVNGVPVFQAEDMFVEHDKQKYSPIFFSKADLDAALADAHSQQQGSQHAAYVKKADKCKAAYDAECAKFAKAGGEKAKAAARKRLEKAQEEEAQWRAKAKHVAEAGLPKIEVSSLEDVLKAMKADTTGQWKAALFIPPGHAQAEGVDADGDEKLG